MCPERELLSAYYDNELEAPWKDKVRSHLEICEQCRQKIKEFKQLSIFLQNDPEPFISDVMDKVREKIYHRKNSQNLHHIWERKISLPIPIFAVAAAFLIAIGAIFIFRMTTPDSAPNQITVSKDASGRTEVQISGSNPKEMETLLKLLEKQNSRIFQLPSEGQVWTQGEPKLIREVDFKRIRE